MDAHEVLVSMRSNNTSGERNVGSSSGKFVTADEDQCQLAGAHSGELLDTAAKLHRFAELAHLLASDRIEAEAANLAERLREGRFYVACIGQFKRGKSTLLNALIGDSVLPTGVVPITAVPAPGARSPATQPL